MAIWNYMLWLVELVSASSTGASPVAFDLVFLQTRNSTMLGRVHWPGHGPPRETTERYPSVSPGPAECGVDSKGDHRLNLMVGFLRSQAREMSRIPCVEGNGHFPRMPVHHRSQLNGPILQTSKASASGRDPEVFHSWEAPVWCERYKHSPTALLLLICGQFSGRTTLA
jgi:hypothetical protein